MIRTWRGIGALLADAVTALAGHLMGRLLRAVEDAHDTNFEAPTPAELADHMPDNLHVMPTTDLIEHHSDEDCICGPTPSAVFRTDGTNGWIHTHHALDRREATE